MASLPPTFTSGRCWGSFSAAQGLLGLADSSNRALLGVRLPEDMSRTRMIDCFVEFMKAQPELASKEFGWVLILCFRTRFPCKT